MQLEYIDTKIMCESICVIQRCADTLSPTHTQDIADTTQRLC